jgi:hypothetical protein
VGVPEAGVLTVTPLLMDGFDSLFTPVDGAPVG